MYLSLALSDNDFILINALHLSSRVTTYDIPTI